MTHRCCIMLLSATLGATAAAAQARQSPPPDYGLDWATMGAPGNRPVTEKEAPGMGDLRVGSVGYEYRLTRTEVTVSQWFEFVRAYAPHWAAAGGNPRDPQLTGWWIDHGPSGHYITSPGAANFPAVMGWRLAARYCNWLHNGKVNESWAFESGAYDTSTFVMGPDGIVLDQATHSPGAQFWIPTGDEWVKAAYYDPDRYGPGQEGYWRYPLGSNDLPVSGFPWDGGETNAGDATYPLIGMDVGSYPDSTSPWGLLDMSGGEEEWTGTISGDANRRVALGSRIAETTYPVTDFINWYMMGTGFYSSLRGLRVASAVPAPGAGALLIGTCALTLIRRRPIRPLRSAPATTSPWCEPMPSMPTSAPTPPRAAASRRSAPTTARSAAR